MIQRIQTIFLFLSFAICGLLMVVNPIYAEFEFESGGSTYQAVLQLWSSFGEEIDQGLLVYHYYWLNLFLMISSCLLTFVSIFIFRYSKIQIYFILGSTTFNIILAALLMYNYINFKNLEVNISKQDLNAHIFWFVLILALNVLAMVSIQLDRRSIPQSYFGSPKA